MLVTPSGHCYVGQFSHDYPAPEAPLLTIDLEQRASPATEHKLAVANGMVFRPGSRTLIVAESWACLLSAFDVDEKGGLSNYRIFAKLPPEHFPDGICGDDAGGIWVACVTGKFVRVVEGGEITHRLTLDEGRFAYACAIGGEDRQTLFLCTGGPYETSVIVQHPAARIETIRGPFRST
nr:SMP-30/gluconolactonase/LRE family protein [Sphingobium sp. EM0848]